MTHDEKEKALNELVELVEKVKQAQPWNKEKYLMQAFNLNVVLLHEALLGDKHHG